MQNQQGLIKTIMQYLAKNQVYMMGGHLKSQNSFRQHAGYNSGNFKRNRRKELKLSRRRKMAPHRR